MDTKYCCEQCEKGQKFVKRAIRACESVFDAVLDFSYFIKECFETCPHKEFHKKENSND